jgi:hypothetical protein
MIGKAQDQITLLEELYRGFIGKVGGFIQELEMVNFFKTNPAAMAQAEAANLLRPSDFVNMKFFGLDLSRIPTYQPDVLFGEQMAIYLPLLLFPIIGVISTYASGKISMASTSAQSAQNQQASSMNKSMQVVGPVMTLIFSFQLPAGVLIYWTSGYLIQIVQQLFMNKYILKLGGFFPSKQATQVTQGRIAGGGAAAGGNALAAGGNAATGGNAEAGGVKNIAGGMTGDVLGGEYGGNSIMEKIVGFAGGTGGRVKPAGTEGYIHGGTLETSVNIPGITNVDFDPEDETVINFNKAVNIAKRKKTASHTGKEGRTGKNTSAARIPAERDRANNQIRAAEPQPHETEAQAPRGADQRSNTKRNYGSSKRKKKK